MKQILNPAAVLTGSSFLEQRGVVWCNRHVRSVAPTYMCKINPEFEFH